MKGNVTDEQVLYPTIKINLNNITFQEWILIDLALKKLEDKNYHLEKTEIEVMNKLKKEVENINEQIKHIINKQ